MGEPGGSSISRGDDVEELPVESSPNGPVLGSRHSVQQWKQICEGVQRWREKIRILEGENVWNYLLLKCFL